MTRCWIMGVMLAMGVSSRCPGADASGDPVEQATRAYQLAIDASNRDDRVEQFWRAETLFRQTIDHQRSVEPGQPIHAELYVNLGNAALGAEHVGAAILAYRRALISEPQHRRAMQNLRHARTLLPDWVPKPDSEAAMGSFFDFAGGLRSRDWHGLAAVAFLVAMILWAVHLRTEASTARHLAAAVGIAWIVALAMTMTQHFRPSPTVGVVVIPDVIARAADSMNAPAALGNPLPSGSEFQVIEVRDSWLRVRLFDGRETWLPASAVETLGKT
ncbi:MAG: SH3 domain-containing protein [Planctomycetota bacterium]